MATSGTVAQTVIDTATLFEHACRRCGIPAANQTPETVEIGKQNLYLLLLNLGNRGLNLWCVEKDLMPLVVNQKKYVMDTGTLRVLNVMYSQPTRVTGTDTVGATSFTTDIGTSTKVVRYGFKPQADVTAAFTVESSDDGATWTTAQTLVSQAWAAGVWNWFELDPAVTAQYFRISSVTPFTLTEFYLASSVRDIPMTQFNRDEYAAQPNKDFPGRPATNYFYEKLLEPTLTLWPVPNNGDDHLSVWRHRFVQDVGTLTQQIEVPQQWMEAIIWMLAARLAYELPGVEPTRRGEVIQASQQFLAEAEMSETDNGPIYMYANVSCYTR